MHTQKHSAQPGCMNWSCAHGKLPMYSVNTRTTSTALPSFSHDKHHKTDAAKRKGEL